MGWDNIRDVVEDINEYLTECGKEERWLVSDSGKVYRRKHRVGRAEMVPKERARVFYRLYVRDWKLRKELKN